MTEIAEKPIDNMAQRVGKAAAAFDDIRLDYPPQTAAYEALLEVYYSASNRMPGRPCGGALLVAPYGSGKTISLEMLRDTVAKGAEPRTTPVLLVETSTAGTPDSLPTSILQALGQPRPEAGNEKARWARSIAELKKNKVDFVIFDEFNRAARRITMSKPMVTSIREKIMDAGVAAVGLVGSDEASVVLRSSPEMVQRLDDHIDLAPLDQLIKEDMNDLITFLHDLDEALLSPVLLGKHSDLSNADTARKICEAANGRIRSIMKIIRSAMLSAIRAGNHRITNDDLFVAADLLAVRTGQVEFNPFSDCKKA